MEAYFSWELFVANEGFYVRVSLSSFKRLFISSSINLLVCSNLISVSCGLRSLMLVESLYRYGFGRVDPLSPLKSLLA